MTAQLVSRGTRGHATAQRNVIVTHAAHPGSAEILASYTNRQVRAERVGGSGKMRRAASTSPRSPRVIIIVINVEARRTPLNHFTVNEQASMTE